MNEIIIEGLEIVERLGQSCCAAIEENYWDGSIDFSWFSSEWIERVLENIRTSSDIYWDDYIRSSIIYECRRELANRGDD